MKILILSNLYPPYARGGAEQVAARSAAELFVRGHKVSVLSTRPYEGRDSLTARVMERDLEPVYRFFPLNLYHSLNDHKHSFPIRWAWHSWDIVNPHARYEMFRVLTHVEPDVVLSHNLKGLGLSVIPEIRRFGIRHVHVVHDVQLSIPSGLLIKGSEHAWPNLPPLRTAYELAVKATVGSPDVIVSPSKFLADFYKARGFFPKSQVEILPNPAPDSGIPLRGPRHPGPVRLLFAGQLEDHKGIRFLLRALEKWGQPFELHVAGEGVLSPMVKSWAMRDKRVKYHGYVSFGHLVKLFAICDAVTVPSLCYENSPTVIYESQRAGLPVIGANIGGIGELVEHGRNGLLFEAGNEKQLLATLDLFVKEQTVWRGRDANIRDGVEPYALGHYVDKLEQLMKPV